MGYIDDIRMRVEQSLQGAQTDLQTYIKSQITDPLVRVGQAAQGNLTEEQIRAGQKSQGGAIAPSKTESEDALESSAMLGNLPMLIIIGAVSYFLFFSKKSRG